MSQNLKKNNGFTLIELLIVIAIIGVLSAMTLGVLADSADNAKKSRTKVQIRRINNLIMDLWESFETRPIPVRIPNFARGPKDAARIRLAALRELMRLELPDRYTDITSGPIMIDVDLSTGGIYTVDLQSNSLNAYYQSQLSGVQTVQFQGAECLYLILSGIQDEFGTGLDSFNDSEIGDVDGDGMMEILDGWGTPIEFLRWAPGMSELAADFEAEWTPPPTVPTTGLISPVQSGDGSTDPDPFDPLRADLRVDPGNSVIKPEDDTFRLVPLIYSAGSDRSYDIWRRDEFDSAFHDFGSGATQVVDYTITTVNPLLNDPYFGVGLDNDTTPSVGFRVDWDGDGYDGFIDNVDNHFGFEQ